ncbi:MAG: tRNA threonylcarbamoyladenosine dehydratase [Oscillospiraceae bacterium]|nr:tRNA threonylcarbamoyladenosine dehydratase [Oscillospiraceae bacterium]
MPQRFIRNEMLLGKNAAERLSQSKVAVFGLGGVGSWCAEALARAGVGEFTLIDGALIAESNINRQIIATASTVGRPKPEVMAERLLEINPGVKVRIITSNYEAARRDMFFDETYDYVADAIDLVSCKVDLTVASLERGIPVISSLGMGNKLDPSGLRICDISETNTCPLARVMRRELRKRGIVRHTVVSGSEHPLRPEPLEEPPPGRRSVPGAVVWVTAVAGMMIAGHIVTEIIKTDGAETNKKPAAITLAGIPAAGSPAPE